MRTSKSLLLATAGFLVALSGASYAHDMQDGQMGGGWKSGKHQCMQGPQFTEAQRELLRSTWKQTHSENKPLYERLHQIRKEMAAITKADSFDQNAFLAKSSEAEKIRDQIMENRIKGYVAVAPQFSPEQRKFLLKKAMHHGRHHGHHYWGYGDKGKEGWKHRGMQDGNAPAEQPQPDATPAQ